MNEIYLGDNYEILRQLDANSIDLVYIDPPFNTGKTQKITPIQTIRDNNGDRTGFQGHKYRTIELDTKSYEDSFNHEAKNIVNANRYLSYQELAPWSNIYYIEVFLKPRLLEAYRVLKDHGSLYFHIDYREAHYCKILLDEIFGRENFLNEIIWAYDFGGRARSRWPAKHDNILFYVKNKDNYFFNQNAIERIDYMAPGLVGPEKANRGKIPTDAWWWTYVGTKGMKQSDTWWMSIVGTNSNERTGYPTQKPVDLINRIIEASTLKGFKVLDFFAGSGTTGESCLINDREFILIDDNPSALEVMATRFSGVPNIEWIGFDPTPYQLNDSQVAINISKQGDQAEEKYELSEDFLFLFSASSQLQEEFEEQSDLWKNSPFEWITQLSPRSKGKIAREILIKWFEKKRVTFERMKDTSETLFINEKEYALKFSTLWLSGVYKFQQIKLNGPNYIICFGLSPFQYHCWVIDKDKAILHGKPQHKGAENSEYWLSINPSDIPRWIKDCGSDLDTVLKVIKSN